MSRPRPRPILVPLLTLMLGLLAEVLQEARTFDSGVVIPAAVAIDRASR